MSDTNPKSEDIEQNSKWFHSYVDRLENHSVSEPPQADVSYNCPCCGYRTLDERGGFTYDPADENGLLTALREAVRRRDELPRMGDHNRRQAEEWNWERVATMTA